VNDSTVDERLLVEAAQDDPAHFLEIYDHYVDRIYAFVSRRIGNRADTEDITSQVFEQALRTIRQFEWRGVPFSAWLFRIASNAITDHWRSRGRAADQAIPELPDPGEAADIDRRLALFWYVDRLPELQRQVIRMRFVEEKSIRDVAAALGRSEGAVKQLQLRALESLRKSMGHHG